MFLRDCFFFKLCPLTFFHKKVERRGDELNDWDVITHSFVSEAEGRDYINCSFCLLLKPPAVPGFFIFDNFQTGYKDECQFISQNSNWHTELESISYSSETLSMTWHICFTTWSFWHSLGHLESVFYYAENTFQRMNSNHLLLSNRLYFFVIGLINWCLWVGGWFQAITKLLFYSFILFAHSNASLFLTFCICGYTNANSASQRK